MNSCTYDWTRFERKIFIAADVPTVFDAWVKPAEIVKWFIAQATVTTATGTPRHPDTAVQVGDHYHWCWHQELQTSGHILEVIPNKTLQFTFGDKEPNSEEKIIVTARFTALDNVTEVTLTQENLPDTGQGHVHWHMGCNMGWSFFMTNLKALLEHGADLREHDPDRAMASRAISA